MTTHTVKVKNTTAIGRLIITFALLPIVFFFAAFQFELGYLIAFLITLVALSLVTFFTIYYLKKTDEQFEIVADSNSITIKGKNYKWNEIESISSRLERSSLNNRIQFYIRFTFKNNKMITLDASNFDTWHEDLVKELNELKDEEPN